MPENPMDRTTMTLRRQRRAIATVFTVHGAVMGTFASRIPSLAEHLHLSTGLLGIALFMPAIGSIAMMPFTGAIIHRIGPRAALRLLLGVYCLSIAIPQVMPSLGLLCLSLVVYGAAAGLSDVAMNSQGSALEGRMGTSIMSSLHGMWSVGGFLAAAIATVVTRLSVGAPGHLAVMAVVLLAVGQVAVGALPATGAGGVPAPVERPRFGFPAGIVLLIALVGFCAVFGEVAGADWSAVYMRTVAHTGSATAAATYGVFAALMAVARLTGDRIVRRFGASATVRVSATVGTAGVILVILSLGTPVTIVGFALLGLGIATVVPLAFAAAGRVGGAGGGHAGASNAIAGVATIAYGAGLAAPGVIGGLADLTSLRWSFVFVAGLTAMIVVAGAAIGSGGDMRPDGPAGMEDAAGGGVVSSHATPTS
jgi:MFS family permease